MLTVLHRLVFVCVCIMCMSGHCMHTHSEMVVRTMQEADKKFHATKLLSVRPGPGAIPVGIPYVAEKEFSRISEAERAELAETVLCVCLCVCD
jgi:hypothetical protein